MKPYEKSSEGTTGSSTECGWSVALLRSGASGMAREAHQNFLTRANRLTRPLEPMTRRVVISLFQIELLWRAPHHGSAHRSLRHEVAFNTAWLDERPDQALRVAQRSAGRTATDQYCQVARRDYDAFLRCVAFQRAAGSARTSLALERLELCVPTESGSRTVLRRAWAGETPAPKR